MALKDIFTMIKADRYTADGCEEIKKAQEAIKEETADAGLPDGSVSHRKDGDYVKKAGKWVPAKRANGGAKKAEGDKPSAPTQKKEVKPAAGGWEETRMASGKIYDLKSRGKRIIEQYDPETETKTFKLRDLNNSRTPDKEFKSLEEAKTAATKSAENKPAERLPAIPTKGMSKSYIRGTQLMKPADSEKQRGEQYWSGVLSGYQDSSVIEQRKKLQETYDEFEDDIKDYDRRNLAPAVYAKRINQQNFLKGALKAIDDEIESRGLDPMPNFSVPRDAAPRQLTGDCKVRIKKS